jgi:hypothetical protein
MMTLTLPGPSRTIIVEPIEEPASPALPREPAKEPAPAPKKPAPKPKRSPKREPAKT